MTPDIQRLVAELQLALRIEVTTGEIILNLTDKLLQSVKTTTYTRIAPKKSFDKPRAVRVN